MLSCRSRVVGPPASWCELLFPTYRSHYQEHSGSWLESTQCQHLLEKNIHISDLE